MRHQRSSRPDRIPRRDEFGRPAHDMGMIGAPMVGMDSPVWELLRAEQTRARTTQLGATGLALAVDGDVRPFESAPAPEQTTL